MILMDELINFGPVPTPDYIEVFNMAFQFGVIMLFVGLLAGFLIGWGLHRFFERRSCPDPLA